MLPHFICNTSHQVDFILIYSHMLDLKANILRKGDGKIIDILIENEDNLSNINYNVVYSFKSLAVHQMRA